MKNKISIIVCILLILVVGILFFKTRFNHVLVEDISLDVNNLTINVGSIGHIGVTIFPDNAEDKTLFWESSNENIAIVNEDGIVIGLTEGEVDIIVSTSDKVLSKSCHVVVKKIPIERITLLEPDITLKEGESNRIIVNVEPSDAEYPYFVYQSSNESVASVDNDGNILAKKEGTTEIIVRDEDNTVETKCQVKVIARVKIIEVEKVELDKRNVELSVGKDEILKAMVTPLDASNPTIIWSSSNPKVATIDDNGVIHTLSKGVTTITATSVNGKTATCSVVVKQLISMVTLNKKTISMRVGQSEKLKAIILPTSVSNKKVTWTSSNPKIATVDSEGNVKGISVGTAVIIVKADESGKRAICVVTVTKSLAKPIVPPSPFVKYESSTLKYYIQGYNRNAYYLTFIWMEDPYNQIRKMDPTIAQYGKVMTDAEVDSNGLSKIRMNIGDQMAALVSKGVIPASKGAIGANGGGFFDVNQWPPDSPYYDKRSSSWIVMSNGVLTRNRISQDDAPIDTIIGITSRGNLKIYGSGSGGIAQRQSIADAIKKDKVNNTWAFNPVLIGQNASIWYDTTKAQRNGICQINSNNYVMFTSGNDSANYIDMAEIFKGIGCKVAFNLDGGGSTSLFYKVGGSQTINQVKCGSNPCRAVIEGIYFTEK